jgi:hypothetical protein
MAGRLARGVALWVAGTAIAVTVAWLGAEVVLRDAASGGPQPPVLSAASPTQPAASAASGSSAGPAPPAGHASPGRAPSAGPAPTPAGSHSPRARSASAGSLPSPGAGSPGPEPTPTGPLPGTIHSYALTGGRVTLQFATSSVQLVTATPAAGFSVQTWSGAGWLRVDFSAGPDVSSLIATWNSGTPTVQTFTDG